jgi:hypothetical protein
MYLLCEKIEHFMDFYGQKRLVIAEDDVCYKKFSGLNESVVFWQFDALFSEARTICEVDCD